MTVTQLRRRFRVPEKTALITFEEGHEFEGAEIELRLSMSVNTVLELQKLQTEDFDAAITRFADAVLISWNLDGTDGFPLPATPDGLKSLPFDFVNALMARWQEVATGAPAPLPRGYATGVPPRELGLG